MAKKTNNSFNGYNYYKIQKKVGIKWSETKGMYVDDIRTFRGKTKKEAEIKLQNFLDARSKGLSSSNQYFGIMADKYIESVFLQDVSLATGTKELYLSAWNKYIKGSSLYGMKLGDIQSIDIQSVYNSLDCSNSALKNCHKLMRKLYRYFDLEGYCRDLTSSLILPAKQKKDPLNAQNNAQIEVEVWSDEEVKAILNSFVKAQNGFRLRFFIILALNTGLRISELLALTYDDITGDEVRVMKQAHLVAGFNGSSVASHSIEVTHCKSPNSVRNIPLSDMVLKELQIHKAWHRKDMLKNGYRTQYLFTTSSGALYDRQNVSAALDRYYKRIGVPPKGVHTYRRTFGTNLCKAGVPIEVASKLLGHASIDVTYKYYISVENEQKKAGIEKLVSYMNK